MESLNVGFAPFLSVMDAEHGNPPGGFSMAKSRGRPRIPPHICRSPPFFLQLGRLCGVFMAEG